MSNNIESSSMSKCAACGKGGDNLKVCTSCEQVSYCNAKCRNSHRSKHKKECKQYAAEKRNKNAAIRAEVDAISKKLASIEISDEELFADPPPKEDCEICFLPMPYSQSCGVHTTYQVCCGKTLCNGCMRAANNEMEKGNMKRCCPFCQVPLAKTDEEIVKRCKKRVEMNDANSFYMLGGWYLNGDNGLLQSHRKAFELFQRGAGLGSIKAHYHLAKSYHTGEGVESDEEKSKHHLMLAAMGGFEHARHMLGVYEHQNGNMERAMKHYMIAARCGYDDALEDIHEGYKAGHVTKEEYASTLRAHKAAEGMKSEQRAIAQNCGRR